MNLSDHSIQNLTLTSWTWIEPSELNPSLQETSSSLLQPPTGKASLDLLNPVRQWLDNLKVQNPKFAHSVCKLIPAQCPFERDIKLLGRTLFHIPPLCKLNPVYEQVVGLRFRALCYLADECGEDVTPYC